LAAAFGVSRKEQDEYALRSHTLAHKATSVRQLSLNFLVEQPSFVALSLHEPKYCLQQSFVTSKLLHIITLNSSIIDELGN